MFEGFYIYREERIKMKGRPKQDGSGRGRRINRGRRGCSSTRSTGRGKRSNSQRR